MRTARDAARARGVAHRFSVRAAFVVDASGPRGFLSRALNIPEQGFDGYPVDAGALFAFHRRRPLRRHARLRTFAPSHPRTLASRIPSTMPRSITYSTADGCGCSGSATVSPVPASPSPIRSRSELRLSEGEPAWRRFLAQASRRSPRSSRRHGRFASSRGCRASPTERAGRAGEGWAMLPSAAAFIDPLFSTGIPLTLLGIERLAETWRRGGS